MWILTRQTDGKEPYEVITQNSPYELYKRENSFRKNSFRGDQSKTVTLFAHKMTDDEIADWYESN